MTIAAVYALAAFAAGCASPVSRFYTLSATTTSATGPNQVRLEEFNRWASPLQNSIARVVAENLVGILGTPQVTLFPQTMSSNADYRAAIEVQRFESAPGEAAMLDAAWTVSRTKDGKSQTGRTTVREVEPDKGYDALAAAHSRALARLSQDIADAVRAIGQQQ
jgi:uncharacterized lipoprotein YmbA